MEEVKNEDPTEQHSELSEQDIEFCRQSADFILEITQCSSYSILSAVTRLCSFLYSPSRNIDERKALIKKYISEYQNPEFKKIDEVRNAALIHFEFIDSLHTRTKIPTENDVHIALLSALNNEKLTLYFANNLYKSFHKSSYTHEKTNENVKSKSWQSTMQMINAIALSKLEVELSGMRPSEQLALLKQVKKWPIFNEHISNYKFTGGFGRTSPVQQIDLMINELETAHPEIQPPDRNFSLNV